MRHTTVNVLSETRKLGSLFIYTSIYIFTQILPPPFFYFMLASSSQVGMRHFHVLRNREHCPIVNLDKLWSMLPAGTLEEAKAAGGKAPVIDVTDCVSVKKKLKLQMTEEAAMQQPALLLYIGQHKRGRGKKQVSNVFGRAHSIPVKKNYQQ